MMLSEFWQVVLTMWVFFGIPAVPLSIAFCLQWKQRGRTAAIKK